MVCPLSSTWMYMYRTQGGFNYLFHGQAQDEHTTLFRQQAGKKIKKMATLRRENRVRANGITRQGSRRSSRCHSSTSTRPSIFVVAVHKIAAVGHSNNRLQLPLSIRSQLNLLSYIYIYIPPPLPPRYTTAIFHLRNPTINLFAATPPPPPLRASLQPYYTTTRHTSTQ
jgi:hypothetical protein